MIVHQAYKYRIYPNADQQQLIRRMFGCCRFVFNHFLAKWNSAYSETGKGLSYHSCATALPAPKNRPKLSATCRTLDAKRCIDFF
ncbi:helix-turn-helix domain-containing protein [Paenibacillus sp. YN15]|uniref:helix-turn-helix domain-containing protein n=1 Tax=Paenibacillus sp. YN15 TaxID=1742774 RepID=UPI00215C09FB|nr:helix-turn-helix domain-containing protein [Paenibacillus sp. YN15]